MFGSTSRSQIATPTLREVQFANQIRGTRNFPYSQTPEVDGPPTSGIQSAAKLDSISAVFAYSDKSHEELMWEDYQLGGLNTLGDPAAAPTFPYAANDLFPQKTTTKFSYLITEPLPHRLQFYSQLVASTLPSWKSNTSPSLCTCGAAGPVFPTNSIFRTSSSANASSCSNAPSFVNSQSAGLFQSSPAFQRQLSSGGGSASSPTPTKMLEQPCPDQTSNMFSFRRHIQPASTGGFPCDSHTINQAPSEQQEASTGSVRICQAIVPEQWPTVDKKPVRARDSASMHLLMTRIFQTTMSEQISKDMIEGAEESGATPTARLDMFGGVGDS